MRKILGVLLMLVVVQASAAEWVTVEKEDKLTIYMNMSSIKKEGNLRRVWTLRDYKEKQIGEVVIEYLSVKDLLVFNCANATYGMKATYFTAKNMGKGKVVSFQNFKSVNFLNIPADSSLEKIYKRICRK